GASGQSAGVRRHRSGGRPQGAGVHARGLISIKFSPGGPIRSRQVAHRPFVPVQGAVMKNRMQTLKARLWLLGSVSVLGVLVLAAVTLFYAERSKRQLLEYVDRYVALS